MSTSRTLVIASLGLLATAAHAGGTGPGPAPTPIPIPRLPAPLEPICDPAKDPDCVEIILTNPGDGSIYPDPTFSEELAIKIGFGDPNVLVNTPNVFTTFNPESASDVRVWLMVSVDREFMYFAPIMFNVDPGGQADLGVTAADLNGDGNLDLVVGEPHNSRMADDAGALHVFYGPLAGGELRFDRPDHTIYGTVRGGEVGLGVGRVAGVFTDGLRVNGPSERTLYLVPADGSALPSVLTERDLTER